MFLRIVRTKLKSRKNIFQKGAHLIKNKKYSTKRFSQHLEIVRCSKRYPSDLEQGGLEIPGKIIFQNSNERIIEEMKKKLVLLSRNIIKNINCYMYMQSDFLKKFHSLNSIFFSRIRCTLKLGALKTKFLTRWALNNKSQKLFETGCALN